MKETNDQNYPSIDARSLSPVQDFILVAWELCQENIRLGSHILIRPDTHRKMHYTAEVIAVGPDVNPTIMAGDRIVFDQFSDPNKYWDEKLGRIALLKEERQGQLFMLISERTKVEGSEPEYNLAV